MSEQQMANYTLTIQADSGYESTTEGRCTAEQYGQAMAALHGAPPQREWVGLTQEDIDIAFDDTQEGGGFNDFARAIEQRLKEKNNVT